MAAIENPRKDFNWSIQVVPNPINPMLCQKVTIPGFTINQVKHGDANFDVKTAGRIEFDDIEIEKLMTTDGADNYMWDWAMSCQDAIIGGGLTPDLYKRQLLITELAEDGTSILNTYLCTGAWPTKMNGQELNRMSSENSLERVTLSVDIVEKL